MKLSDLFDGAASYLRVHGWKRGELGTHGWPRCAMGAMQSVVFGCGYTGQRYTGEHMIRRANAFFFDQFGFTIPHWNDNYCTSREEAARRMEQVAELARAREQAETAEASTAIVIERARQGAVFLESVETC